jgi:adenylate cyclase
MTAAEYEASGLYTPGSPKAAERLELLEWLSGRGFTIEHMLAADGQGQLLFLGTAGVLRPGPYLTQSQLGERLGVDLASLEEFRVAFALPPRGPDEAWCNEAEAELFRGVAEGVGLFGDRGMQRLTRVLGASASRVAAAMSTSNHARGLELIRGGASELELAKANLGATESAGAPAAIFTGLLSIHLELAASRVRSRRSEVTAETVNACVGFVDIVGSTALSRGLSAAELAAIVDRFEEVAYRVAANGQGRIVKFIGDEVMFVTGQPDEACEIALSLIEAFDADEKVTPRGGLAFGALLDRGGDYYGPMVNLAARLAELAVPREVLVSTETAQNINSGSLICAPAGRRLLRGFDEPIELMSVTNV